MSPPEHCILEVTPTHEADGFYCAFCGQRTPWRMLGGWSWRRRRRFCDGCIKLMDAIALGGDEQ